MGAIQQLAVALAVLAAISQGTEAFNMLPAAALLRSVRGTTVRATAAAGAAVTANSGSPTRSTLAAFAGDRRGASAPFTSRWSKGSSLSMSTAAAPVKVAKSGPSLKPSATHDSYELLSEEFVPEYGTTNTLYRHKKTGAEILSVQAEDDNKVFGVTFRTPPEDSTGVPHVLEHSVLCGSKKYPVKEPFVDLLKGSLQTFLNAFTYPDRTCYPVASQNTQDFYNLMSVYLDAVFFPRAVKDPQVIQQEGWHYELENPEEPLTYKGVVFNEMKGVYSSPDSRHNRACQQALFPDNTYGVDSGGDPLAIPDLTFDYFKGFHAKYYHPGNARVYFYGDDDPTKRLELLEEYLNQFEGSVDKATTKVQWQKKVDEPWSYTEKFPANEESADKHMLSVNWLVNDKPLSVRDSLVLNIVDDLLVGNNAAVLSKALTESGLGQSVIGGGLSDELLQATFSMGLKGVAPADVPKVEKLIFDTLNKVLEDGFEQDAIDACINSMEFSLREFNTGSFPRGLSYMLGAMSKWVYDGNPTEGLKFEEPLRQMKAELAEGKPIFTDMVRDLLVNNKHRVSVEMVPDTGMGEAIEEAEKSKLEGIKSKLSEEQVFEIIESTKELKQAQAKEDSPEARATLPSLSVGDLEKKGKEIPIETTMVDGVEVVTHPMTTSGILYADVGVSLTGLPIEDFPLVGLLSNMLLETGTSTMDRVQLTRKIGARTGGISASSITTQKYNGGKVVDPTSLISYLFVRGKAVSDNAGELFGLMHDVITDANLDSQQRVVEMLKDSKAQMDASVASAGHSFASSRLESRYTLEGYMGEIAGGVSHIQTVKDLLHTAENDWPTLLARLEKMRATLLKKENFIINMTGDESVLSAAQTSVEDFVGRVGDVSSSAKVQETAIAVPTWAEVAKLNEVKNEGFAVQTQVNYVGSGGRIYDVDEKVPASTAVVGRALRTGFLWDNVRVIGGAYGAFCRFSGLTGIMSFLSYRDPNLEKTLDAYDATATYLQGLKMSQEELDSNIIGTVGDLDSPMSPDQKGFVSLRQHLMGQRAEDRMRVREEVLATTVKDFNEFGDRLAGMKDKGTATIGSKSAFESANKVLGEKEQIHIVEL